MTTGETADPTVENRPETRTPRRSLVALRVTALLTLLSTAAQPVLAGMFLDHDVAALVAHQTNAGILHLVQLVQLVVAWVYWRPGGGRVGPLILTAVLWILTGVQFAVGEEANLTLHVPLGTVLVLLQSGLTWWSFGANARRGRTGVRGRGAS